MDARTQTPEALAQACQSGDRRAAARLISMLESGDKALASETSNAVSRLPLPAQTIGITGPPGAGKSTLVSYATALLRARNEKVGVLAIDPSSPFTGGALLGDRIRMAGHRNDTAVFIRSMGNRGASGGLAAAASDTLRVLAAAGYHTIFLETIGAGQAEIEIASLADTVCVVQVPGLGDDVQLMKMGLLEIADIFVVNKGDKPEADDLKMQLEMAIQDSHGNACRALRQLGGDFSKTYSGPGWVPPVVLLSALQQTGGEAFIEACKRHLDFLRQPELSAALRRNRLMHEILWRTGTRFEDYLKQQLQPGGRYGPALEQCLSGSLSLDRMIATILNSVHGRNDK